MFNKKIGDIPSSFVCFEQSFFYYGITAQMAAHNDFPAIDPDRSDLRILMFHLKDTYFQLPARRQVATDFYEMAGLATCLGFQTMYILVKRQAPNH